MVASEYGWTPTYVLNELTGPQVRGMLEAIDARYKQKVEAMKEGSKPGATTPMDTETFVFDESKIDLLASQFGMPVNRG